MRVAGGITPPGFPGPGVALSGLGKRRHRQPDLPKDYQHVYQRISRIQGDFGGWYKAIISVNILRLHDNWIYLDLLKLIE